MLFSNLYKENAQNFPGHSTPITYRRIRPSDAIEFKNLIRDSRQHLEGYIDWAGRAADWNFKDVNAFVMQHVNAELPREHFVFLLDGHIVAMGSLAPHTSPRSIQLALFVRNGYTGKGIAKSVVQTLENYAFEVIGYEYVYYNHDITNRASGAVPKAMGYKYVGHFEGFDGGQDESGLWLSYRKARPDDLPAGMIQGGEIEKWSEVISGEEFDSED